MAEADIPALVEKARQGDRQAFGELVVVYERLIFGLAFQHVRDSSLAEDVAQESFLRAFKNLGSLRNPTLFGSWLCGIAVNVAREHVRKRPKGEVSLDSIRELPAAAPSAGESEEEKTLLALVAKLPDKYRIPLTLRYISGMKYCEIAIMLGVGQVTVRSLVHRARARLVKMAAR